MDCDNSKVLFRANFNDQKMKIVFPILLLLGSVNGVRCQQPIYPGDKSLRYDLIKPKVTSYKSISVDTTGKVISVSVSEDYEVIDIKRKLIVHIQKRELGEGKILIDSTFADLATLSPIKMSMTTRPHFMSMNLTFEKDKVMAKADINGKKTDVTHSMKELYFDSNILDLVIGILPYKRDFSALINTYTFERNGLDSHFIEYLGDDILFASATPTICHVVAVRPAIMKDKKGLGYRYWIDAKTGTVAKLLVSMPGRGHFIKLSSDFYSKN